MPSNLLLLILKTFYYRIFISHLLLWMLNSYFKSLNWLLFIFRVELNYAFRIAFICNIEFSQIPSSWKMKVRHLIWILPYSYRYYLCCHLKRHKISNGQIEKLMNLNANINKIVWIERVSLIYIFFIFK